MINVLDHDFQVCTEVVPPGNLVVANLSFCCRVVQQSFKILRKVLHPAVIDRFCCVAGCMVLVVKPGGEGGYRNTMMVKVQVIGEAVNAVHPADPELWMFRFLV